ncbi:Uncharacterised protein [Mycobacterium tuberculosis]|nr:Uncharacterised protein [Mycobacterium tuberculosis]CKS51198.1 Uncharacterised protein [Mycobacterium tuberculosis]CKS81651.1 Uncharacterised protein [Mycobacterium tuberculosis]CKU07607.1 Uncharacterised protein [Mycobacterium tuberculosis]CNL72011.1 Uncharacterised protein [Mycobacterium tuberculosis]
MDPAIRVEPPSATVESASAAVGRSSHRDATSTAARATTPYTTAVSMTARFCLPKPDAPAAGSNAYLTRQLRLKPVLRAAPNIDA